MSPEEKQLLIAIRNEARDFALKQDATVVLMTEAFSQEQVTTLLRRAVTQVTLGTRQRIEKELNRHPQVK